MTEAGLKRRTKGFALRTIKLAEALEKDVVGRTIAGQLVRSGTSVGANYRSACRARSTADFASKITIVEEEADESGFWMELIVESGFLPAKRVRPLIQEADELVAIMVASRKTARRAGTIENRKSKIEN